MVELRVIEVTSGKRARYLPHGTPANNLVCLGVVDDLLQGLSANLGGSRYAPTVFTRWAAQNLGGGRDGSVVHAARRVVIIFFLISGRHQPSVVSAVCELGGQANVGISTPPDSVMHGTVEFLG